MAVRMIREGIFTSLQGGPRFGFQSFGFNPGGAMDRAALAIINTLLGNARDALALEMHFPAGKYVFEEETGFALGGAEFAASLDGASIRNWKIVRAHEGAELRFEQKLVGNRCYLAVRGGFAGIDRTGEMNDGPGGEPFIKTVRAMKGGIFRRVPATLSSTPPTGFVSPSLVPNYGPETVVRVIPCGEFDELSDESKCLFLESEFTLSAESDRMGARLKGPELHRTTDIELVSAAVTFGTIQLLPNGQLIVLMADHQTSGGYPRIATIISADLPLAAQLGPGDRISFSLTDQEEAERATLKFENDLLRLKIAASFGKFC